jgi:AmmeMemoRadiSam system protein B
MNRKLFTAIFFLLPLLLLLEAFQSPVIGEDKKGQNVRNSILAGTWYPGNKKVLINSIRDYLSKAEDRSIEGELKAIIVPHAGHIYSGQVAANAYRLLQVRDFKRVIMIGPSHRVGFKGTSVNLQSGYRTPLGTVPVDLNCAKKMIEVSPQIRWIPRAHAQEHSLEIQLPFLQTVLKDFQIVPIVMGQQDFNTCSDLAGSIVKVLGNMKKTLILASSDLSHFHNYNQAKRLDMEFAKHVRNFDPTGLAHSLSSGSCEACGGGPVITVMLVAQASGANRTMILDYANSGDVTGDRRRVVGYLSAALFRVN